MFVVLDGAADNLEAPRRALEEASKPNIDSLAAHGECGLLYVVGRGIAPESDMAVMSLLGYEPSRYYTGRGPLEALGAGVEFREGEVAFRANFATIDPETRRILDRRVGRSLSSEEARELAKALDGMELAGGEGYARFKATIGHRGVLVLGHRRSRLSGMVSNSDPAYERRGYMSVAREKYEPFLARVEPLEDTPEARLTAELANEFIDEALEILDRHHINEVRRRKKLPPANAVLIRDAGDRLPPAEPFREKFGLRAASIVEMPVERGIVRAIGMDEVPVKVEGRDRRDVLREEAVKAIEALRSHDLVYVHLKGPDEPGHDGDFEKKVDAIEDIDRYFFGTLLDNLDVDTAFIITSDHATPWTLKAHSADPVPLLISYEDYYIDGPGRFDERICQSGTLGVIEGGWKVIPLALKKLPNWSQGILGG
ncbi:alkaline phosphatase family protein [Stetteria hydrogenophila]